MVTASITADALKYQGHGYVYGVWDCSSFVNHVLGQDLGMAIPGYAKGTYRGPPPHGPVVLDYATWTGASTVRGQPSPGDLVIWPGAGPNGHIGIVLGPNKMISALDAQLGTAVTPIAGYGPAGITPIYRTVTGAPGGPGAPGGLAGAAASAQQMAAGALAGAAVAGATIVAVVAAAGIIGVAAAALVAAAAAWLLHSATNRQAA